MAAVFVEVADAIVEEIQNAADDNEFSVKLTVSRSWADANEELPDLGKAQIDVVPFMPSGELETDRLLDYSHTVDVLIRRKFNENEIDLANGRASRAEIDKMVLLLQEVWELMSPPNSGELTTASSYSAKWDPIASRIMSFNMRAQLKKLRQYTGLLRLGYRVSKAVG